LGGGCASPWINYLFIAYHLAFAVAFATTVHAGDLTTTADGGCMRAMETAATVTHSYTLAIIVWLFTIWDSLIFLLRLGSELYDIWASPSSASLASSSAGPPSDDHYGGREMQPMSQSS
jgi:hypothetical protein